MLSVNNLAQFAKSSLLIAFTCYTKEVKKFTFATALVVALTGIFAVPQVLAMPDPTIITANCRAAQQIISQIEKADAVSRINRGRANNNVLDLMFAMNARLAGNRIAAPRLTELTSDFEIQAADFRNSYDHYDTELTRAINIDCVQKPADFYNRLSNARGYRQTIADEIKELGKIIDDYKSELNKVTEDLK